MRIERRLVLASALAAPFIRTARADPLRMRVSVDTSAAHQRTVAVADFLKKLEAASQGAIAPELYDNARLLSDRDVIKGLVLGQVEMAVPGTWQVAAYVPEADVGQLPVFYGQPADKTHHATDGIPGDLVNDQISRKLRLAIPGRWLDLGFTNWYSARKPLLSLDDLRGLKIRGSAGFALAWRARYFGGVADLTPWPEVPLALAQGVFDALQTTNESCVSAKLWDSGLRHGLIDHQCMGSYIPLLGEAFWSSLSPALKTLVTDLWSANIGVYRANMAAAQDRAEKELKTRGIKLVAVPADELADRRKRMLGEQDEVAREMKMSPDFVTRVNEAVAVVN